MKKYRNIIFLYGAIIAVGLKAHGSAECALLLEAGEYIQAYVKAIEPALKKSKSQSQSLQIILDAVHKKVPINGNHIDLKTVDSIFRKFGSKEVSETELAKDVSTEQRTLYLELHNKYSRYGVDRLFFGPSAEDVVRFKMAFGCTHYARSLMTIIKELKILPEKNLKYVAAVSAADYKKICESSSDEVMANGHQFLLVKLDKSWSYWNTSNPTLELIPASGWENWKNHNIAILFPSHSNLPAGGKLFIRAIQKSNLDLICDDNLERLRNIYRSGSPADKDCKWIL